MFLPREGGEVAWYPKSQYIRPVNVIKFRNTFTLLKHLQALSQLRIYEDTMLSLIANAFNKDNALERIFSGIVNCESLIDSSKSGFVKSFNFLVGKFCEL